jgi:multicomponent K+:H+ antiporter subunit E
VSRVLPYPLLWLALLAMWLVLNGSVAPGQLVLGAAIATLACLAVRRLDPPKAHLRRIGTIAGLAGVFIADVVKSNIAVLRLVLSRRRPRSEFITIPLEFSEPNALAVLACIITATPGSAWVHYDSTRNEVTVHVLDTEDPAAWSATLKRDYERRLMEIFR